jgi:colanic acid biosynthesis glycosyl transferase WcaI
MALKLLVHGINYAPEEIGIGKYTGEMVRWLASKGVECEVVTAPPYYPQWKIWSSFSSWRYKSEVEPVVTSCEQLDEDSSAAKPIRVLRCPLWVPGRVNGWKRVVHLASFGISSAPAAIWKAISFRPDIILTVEPAAFCMPSTWMAAKLCGAKAWLHVQDFEVDAAFELGILKQPWLKKLVLKIEAFWMRRFNRVSSISTAMVDRLKSKGLSEEKCVLFPNWVDCESVRPLENPRQFRRQFGLPEDKFIALYSGNIGAKQGLEIVVDAAKRLSGNDQVQFVICGTGAAVSKIVESAAGLTNLVFLPPQPFEKFNELLNAADVHLLPQRADAADLVMPSKLGGMLSSGRPVIACATEGTQIAKVVCGRGLVVAPGDAEAIKNAIIQLQANGDLYYSHSQEARNYALRTLSREAIMEDFAKELETLIKVHTKS